MENENSQSNQQLNNQIMYLYRYNLIYLYFKSIYEMLKPLHGKKMIDVLKMDIELSEWDAIPQVKFDLNN